MKRSRQSFLMVATAAVLTGAMSLLAQTAAVSEIPYDSVTNLLKGFPENTYLGEVAGVATNSQGHVFVFTRTGTPQLTFTTQRSFVRGNGGARLFEFDQTGKWVREIGQGLYGFLFARAVRIDPQDNIWAVDEGSNMLIKFNPQGQVVMTFGRKPEAMGVPAAAATGGRGAAPGGGAPAAGGGAGGRGGGGVPGAGTEGESFARPTDVAWDAQGNIFLADGADPGRNSRIAKFDKSGVFVKSWGSTGTAQGQFQGVFGVATDKAGNVYVADRGNRRIQVFDSNGAFKAEIGKIGAPGAICITPGAHQYLYSSNSNEPDDFDQGGEIYKLELDGTVLGKFGKPGKVAKEFGTVNSIDCRNENELLVGELTNWRVQKLTLHPR